MQHFAGRLPYPTENVALLKLCVKLLGGMHASFLSSEEMDLLGFDHQPLEGEAVARAEEVLVRMILAVALEARDKTPRV